MEVKGSLMTTATGNIGAPGSQRYTRAVKVSTDRVTELAERQRAIEEMLRRKMAELRELCLQEAELTGILPSDYPLEPGEVPPVVGRRGRRGSQLPGPSGHLEKASHVWEFGHRFEQQERIANAHQLTGTRALCPDGGSARRVHRYHRWDTMDKTLNENPRDCFYPEGLASVQCGEPSCYPLDTGGNGQNVGQCQGWTLLPADIYCQARGRRRSGASPARLLQRSVSGMERRSVPSSPVIYKDRTGQYRYLTSVPRCTQRPDAPPSEPGVWPGVALTRRTRRSSSSETLSDSATVTRPGRRSLGGSGASGLAGPHDPEGSACPPRRWPGPGSTAGGSHRRAVGERADRDIHRALALEGLRSWYMRAAVHRNQEEWVIPGWRRGSMPVTSQVNWEACRRSARVSQQVRGTPRALWYDPPS
ncbi:coiled-coil domain-containing protein 120-like [Hemiscyllium ocellatum]|uniref:coiled-coil domain-containing protein 120-like n=1 Tax=Hemiscyllium ocellatum TaxID=170820 RepID=UPI0029675A6D|nr:coiled-coil domain-containing protein 120-like [Hemiscyllium ocellatum]